MTFVKRIYLLFILALTFIFLIKVFAAFIGFNPQTPSFKNSVLIQNIVPQGWGFFTRDPRERAYQVFRLEHSGDKIISKTPVAISNSSYKNFFGLSRKARRVHLEMMRLLSYAGDDSSWCLMQDPHSEISIHDVNSYKNVVDSTYQYQHIRTGTYLLETRDKLPWLYYTNDIKKNPNVKFMVLDMKTENDLYD